MISKNSNLSPSNNRFIKDNVTPKFLHSFLIIKPNLSKS